MVAGWSTFASSVFGLRLQSRLALIVAPLSPSMRRTHSSLRPYLTLSAAARSARVTSSGVHADITYQPARLKQGAACGELGARPAQLRSTSSSSVNGVVHGTGSVTSCLRTSPVRADGRRRRRRSTRPVLTQIVSNSDHERATSTTSFDLWAVLCKEDCLNRWIELRNNVLFRNDVHRRRGASCSRPHGVRGRVKAPS